MTQQSAPLHATITTLKWHVDRGEPVTPDAIIETLSIYAERGSLFGGNDILAVIDAVNPSTEELRTIRGIAKDGIGELLGQVKDVAGDPEKADQALDTVRAYSNVARYVNGKLGIVKETCE